MTATTTPSSRSSNSSDVGSKHKPLLLPRIILPLQHAHSSGPQLAAGLAGLHSPLPPSTPQRQQYVSGSSSSSQTLLSLLQQVQASNSTGHKRHSSSSDEGDNDRTSPSAWSPDRKRKKASCRKPTYLVRKEEKDVLLAQVRQLQAQVDYLRERSGVVDWQGKDKQLQQTEIANNMLRESVRNQQFAFFSAQSVVSELITSSDRCPIDTPIHLGKDWSQRRETLVALKAQKLHDAQRLLEKRMQFMDPMKELTEDTSFVSANGDFCSVAFHNVPLHGAQSVRQVYDALHFHTQNMERSISEAMGTVLTSDGDDNWDKTILHRRLVHSTVRDVLVESNFAVFSDFTDGVAKGEWSKDRSSSDASGKDVGVIVLDFVDHDELYPYRARQCVRRDVTGVIVLRSVPCAKTSSSSNSGDQHTVVITKWIMLRLRHNSALAVPDSKMRELRAGIHHISNALVRAVQESTSALDASGKDAAIV